MKKTILFFALVGEFLTGSQLFSDMPDCVVPAFPMFFPGIAVII